MALNKEQRQAEIILNGTQVESTLKQMTQAASVLNSQLRNLKPGTQEFLDKAKELGDVKNRIMDVNQSVKQFQNTVSQSSQVLKALQQFAIQAFAVEKVQQFATEIESAAREMVNLRNEVAKLTGATGTELDNLAINIQAISQAFGQESSEVLASANALAKAYGIDVAQAVGIVEKSLLNVSATQKGEILEQIKEYSVQAKDAGLAVENFAGVLVNSSNQGIFSDKGIDVVKEFGLRIREQTTATRDALQNAFGKQFTDTLFQGINSGSITVENALAQISSKLRDTGLTASQLQTVVADVFGGPGEDAGLEYIRTLDSVAVSIETVNQKNQTLNQTEQNRLNLEKQLATAQNDLAKETRDVIVAVDNATKEFQIWTFQGIVQTIQAIRDLIGWLIENRNILIPLTIAIIAFNAQLIASAVASRAYAIAVGIANVATNAWRIGVLALNLAMRANPIGFVVGLLATLATAIVAAYNNFVGFRTVIDATFAAFKAFIGAIAEGIVALANLDFSKAYNSFANAGSRSAKAFNDAYIAEQKKAEAQRAEANSKIAEEALKAEEEARRDALKELSDFENQKKQQQEQANREQQDRYKQFAEQQLEKQKEYAQKELEARQSLEDLKNSVIEDKFDREIAQLETSTQRKIAELQKEGQLTAELKRINDEQIVLIEQQTYNRISELREAQRAQEETREREFRQAQIDNFLKTLDEQYALQSEKDEAEFEAKRLRLEEQLLIEDEDAILRYEQLAFAEQERQTAEYEAQRLYLESKLELLRIAGQAETAEAQKIGTQLLQIQNEQNQRKLDADKKLAEGRKAIQAAELGVAKDFLDLGLEIAGENAEAKVALGTINSILTIADIVQKSNAEIAGYYTAYSAIPGGVAIASGLAGAAKVRAGIAIATVLAKTVKSFKLEKGGLIGEIFNQFYQTQKMANGGMLYGPSHAQGGIPIPGTGIEVEGGEFVANRLSSIRSRRALEIINARPDLSFMAIPVRRFETGGEITPQESEIPAGVELPAQSNDMAMIGQLVSEVRTLVQVINEKSDSFKEVNLSIIPLMDLMEEVKSRQQENQG